jgi:hypothetical protein
VAHLSDHPPSLRTEAYPAQILDKLDFCVGYGNHHADLLVLLGDVFHIKTPSRTAHRLVQAAAEVPNPGGWDEGLAQLGRTDVIGIDHDRAVCAAAEAAGHACVLADLADLPTTDFAGLDVLVASPRCQAWSQAGRRDGEHDVTRCHRLADRVAAGEDDWSNREVWCDPRSVLVRKPLRWARDLQPDCIALEVLAVLGLWRYFVRILTGWGYDPWTGTACGPAKRTLPCAASRDAYRRVTIVPTNVPLRLSLVARRPPRSARRAGARRPLAIVGRIATVEHRNEEEIRWPKNHP